MDRVEGDRQWTGDPVAADPFVPAGAIGVTATVDAAELARALPAPLYVTDWQGALTFYNDEAAALWEMRPPLGRPGWWRGWRLVQADGSDLPFHDSPLAAPADPGGPPVPAEAAMLAGDGEIRSFLVLRRALAGGDTLTLLIDVSARAADEQRYRHILELSDHLPWIAGPDGEMIEIDPRWLAVTGLRREEALGRGAAAAFHPDDAERVTEVWTAAIRDERPVDVEHRLRLADGRYRWFRSRSRPRRGPDGRTLGWYGMTEDIHDRRIAIDEVRWSAEHDGLTELPNRRAFTERLCRTLSDAGERGGGAGLLLLDIDHFKQVNDALGHDAGDALLRNVADRLRAAISDEWRIARLGGDEFAVIIPGATSPRDVERQAEALLQRLSAPFQYRGQVCECRTSVGAAFFPRDGRTGGDLMKSADIALYEAKTAGRSRVQIFRSAMRADLQRRASMLSLARDALGRQAIAPFYQPKINLASGRICGFEALLRWRHDRDGWQLPSTVAAAFEDTELSVHLSDAMLDRVVEDIARWRSADVDSGRIAINASAVELRRPDYATRVLDRLAAAGLPGSVLEVEVTEMVFLGRSTGMVGEQLAALCSAGVTIALDDFGTGFASLSHLKQFPVDAIKIDRSFVAELGTTRDDLAILRALIGLGRNLNIVTVAEGIETREQAARLRLEGCPIGQGFLFSPAVPADEVPALIGSWKPHQHRAGRKC